MRITAVPLKAYAARTFVKEVVKPPLLIGDAAAGFPYEIGTKFGIPTGRKLANAIRASDFAQFQTSMSGQAEKTLEEARSNHRYYHNIFERGWSATICPIIAAVSGTRYTTEEVAQFRQAGEKANRG